MSQQHTASRSRRRLAIVVTHPIQYLSHVYRWLAACKDLHVKVFYGARIGLQSFRDPGFGVELAWDCDLLSGFDHEFLPGAERVNQLTWRELARVDITGSLSRFDPNAVLLHGYSHPLVLRAWRWARSRGRRTILFGDGNGRHELARPLPLRLAKRAILGQVLKSMSSVLSLGEANTLFWETLGVDRSRLQWAPLYLPAPEVSLPAGAVREHARSEVRSCLGISDSELLVMFSGKMVERKRTIDLVQAVDRCDRLVGLYVGDGPLRPQCEAVATSSRHRFVGFANIPALSRYYAAADVLCHPAEREAYGLVVAEAAASGLPIVASDVVGAIGVGSHGQPGRNARTFKARDVEGIRHTLELLLGDPRQRSGMAAESLAITAELKQACFDGIRSCIFDANRA
jgi:glycosyltransferase involved in cell wall biosynthesis